MKYFIKFQRWLSAVGITALLSLAVASPAANAQYYPYGYSPYGYGLLGGSNLAQLIALQSLFGNGSGSYSNGNGLLGTNLGNLIVLDSLFGGGGGLFGYPYGSYGYTPYGYGYGYSTPYYGYGNYGTSGNVGNGMINNGTGSSQQNTR